MKKIILSAIWILSGCAMFAAKPKKVACIGNSITYGYAVENREQNAYPVKLQQMLGTEYSVANFGKSGATLLKQGHRPYMQQDEFRQAMDFAADIAVIHLGINDTDPRNWPDFRDCFVRDYLDLIDSLKYANKNVRILVARLTPIGDTHPRFISGTKQWHDEIQTAIETVAEISGAELIDFHEPLYPFPLLLPDAIHPNVEGAEILAKTVYSAITGNYGGLRLSELYSDNMVLQRNQLLEIQGKADAAAKVTVQIAGQKATTTADNRGRWRVTLQPLQAGTGYELRIKAGKDEKVFRHVAVGEVWLCSGQSNMQFMLKQAVTAQNDIPLAADDDLRLFDMKPRWETNNEQWPVEALDSINHLFYFGPSRWAKTTPSAAADFSAVAYYFGKMLRDSLQVPVGLICNAVGGSPTEAWVDRHALETEFPAILKDGLNNDFVQTWVRGRIAVNIAARGEKPSRHPYNPCYLFESGISPMQSYPIQGVIWYQGESNAHNVEAHEKLFTLLVDSWRRYWARPDMPFYFVQLSSLDRPSWTWFRNSQLQLMKKMSHTGMAVSSDRGDSLDVHPPYKQEVGERLARWALHDTYGRPVIPSGPLFKSAARDGNSILVAFDYADGLRTSDGKAPACFEIAEYDGLYYPAQATIEGDKVRLVSPEVKRPRYVRYAWQPFTRANLVNGAALPASTFRGICPDVR
ncbi:MAG: sialate O-acetylesterase [Coprobacter sp.]|nr:sialate O-acetylesterase [Coprobacter sp.]